MEGGDGEMWGELSACRAESSLPANENLNCVWWVDSCRARTLERSPVTVNLFHGKWRFRPRERQREREGWTAWLFLTFICVAGVHDNHSFDHLIGWLSNRGPHKQRGRGFHVTALRASASHLISRWIMWSEKTRQQRCQSLGSTIERSADTAGFVRMSAADHNWRISVELSHRLTVGVSYCWSEDGSSSLMKGNNNVLRRGYKFCLSYVLGHEAACDARHLMARRHSNVSSNSLWLFSPRQQTYTLLFPEESGLSTPRFKIFI